MRTPHDLWFVSWESMWERGENVRGVVGDEGPVAAGVTVEDFGESRRGSVADGLAPGV